MVGVLSNQTRTVVCGRSAISRVCCGCFWTLQDVSSHSFAVSNMKCFFTKTTLLERSEISRTDDRNGVSRENGDRMKRIGTGFVEWQWSWVEIVLCPKTENIYGCRVSSPDQRVTLLDVRVIWVPLHILAVLNIFTTLRVVNSRLF